MENSEKSSNGKERFILTLERRSVIVEQDYK